MRAWIRTSLRNNWAQLAGEAGERLGEHASRRQFQAGPGYARNGGSSIILQCWNAEKHYIFETGINYISF